MNDFKSHTIDDYDGSERRERQFPGIGIACLDAPGWVVAWEDSHGETHTSQVLGTRERADELLTEMMVSTQELRARWAQVTTRSNLRVTREPKSEFSPRY